MPKKYLKIAFDHSGALRLRWRMGRWHTTRVPSDASSKEKIDALDAVWAFISSLSFEQSLIAADRVLKLANSASVLGVVGNLFLMLGEIKKDSLLVNRGNQLLTKAKRRGFVERPCDVATPKISVTCVGEKINVQLTRALPLSFSIREYLDAAPALLALLRLEAAFSDYRIGIEDALSGIPTLKKSSDPRVNFNAFATLMQLEGRPGFPKDRRGEWKAFLHAAADGELQEAIELLRKLEILTESGD